MEETECSSRHLYAYHRATEERQIFGFLVAQPNHISELEIQWDPLLQKVRCKNN